MSQLGLVTVVVRDYDEAIAFYVDVVGLELREDTRLDAAKRWVVVAPPGAREAGLLLARAATPEQQARIGDQTGGRVGWFLTTDAFDRDHARMRAAGVVFEEDPRHEPYGTVAVFRDLYGNRWDLLQPNSPPPPLSNPTEVPTEVQRTSEP
jgi:catechol 2,3-dioxygenase-like lactoylglutathione lyase family enzyme